MNEPKKTEEVIRNNAPHDLKLCLMLAELESRWREVVGAAAAERSAPVSCEFGDDGPVIYVNVDSPGVLPALRSRKPVISGSICKFLQISSVKLEMRVGKVKGLSSAKDPLPDHLRRPPVLISESLLQKNIEEMAPEVKDEELTECIARLKCVVEKLNLRKNKH